MKTFALVSIAWLALAGCQSAPKPAAHLTGTPQEIAVLTDQTTIYTCPECAMEYDRAGQCPMCKVDLVATHVDYICPADDKPVARSGKCPRCAANARVVKTAMAQKAPGTPTGN